MSPVHAGPTCNRDPGRGAPYPAGLRGMSSPRHPVGASEAVPDVRTPSVAATLRRAGTRVLTLTPSGIRSSSRWSPARIGGGVMSTRTFV